MNHHAPDLIWSLFQQLRHRGYPLSPNDYEALRAALRAGFGWSSLPETLRNLCCALWAKSKSEQAVVKELFDQLLEQRGQSDKHCWALPAPISEQIPAPRVMKSESREGKEDMRTGTPQSAPIVEPRGAFPEVSLEGTSLPPYSYILTPQYPLTFREVAQAWRRLRRMVRSGPREELDVEATIAARCQKGIVSEVVLLQRRRNIAHLLLLVDRQGSMTPFHHFVDEICMAIQQSGNLARVATYYFHNAPAEGADDAILDAVRNQLFPTLDPILSQIEPLTKGFVYPDAELLQPEELEGVLQSHARDAAVLLIGDAGAARGHYDVRRLLDTIAFMKALKFYQARIVWLNPWPRINWANSTAAQIARHIPMFPLDRTGIHQAVNVLRGRPFVVERPI